MLPPIELIFLADTARPDAPVGAAVLVTLRDDPLPESRDDARLRSIVRTAARAAAERALQKRGRRLVQGPGQDDDGLELRIGVQILRDPRAPPGGRSRALMSLLAMTVGDPPLASGGMSAFAYALMPLEVAAGDAHGLARLRGAVDTAVGHWVAESF